VVWGLRKLAPALTKQLLLTEYPNPSAAQIRFTLPKEMSGELEFFVSDPIAK
jgi:hypothetical protein